MSLPAPPILCTWTGEEFVPCSPRWGKLADKFYVVDAKYQIVDVGERSAASHAHYFACLNEAYGNLPELAAAEYPNVEALRKKALIRCGYADSQTFVCGSKAEAQRFVAFLQPIDEYSIVTSAGATVTRFTAKSQSYRAMGKKTFNESKQMVLDYVASLVGLSSKSLEENAGRAA